jgi:hypothetical protein
MGMPEYLSQHQVEQLQKASQLLRQPQSWSHHDGILSLEIRLPPHAVAALTVEFEPGAVVPSRV